jgi:hypothetical protein
MAETDFYEHRDLLKLYLTTLFVSAATPSRRIRQLIEKKTRKTRGKIGHGLICGVSGRLSGMVVRNYATKLNQ